MRRAITELKVEVEIVVSTDQLSEERLDGRNTDSVSKTPLAVCMNDGGAASTLGPNRTARCLDKRRAVSTPYCRDCKAQ